MRYIHAVGFAAILLAAAACFAAPAHEPYRFYTFFVTWTGNGSDQMFDYLERARPEVVQVGFYGPMFHGYAHHPRSTGYPMRLPVAGEKQALERQSQINQQIRELGLKVVGHFQMCNVVEDWDEPFGFVKWYNELWDEQILGPRPVDDVKQLLQRDSEGNVMSRGRYISFIGLCISSPHTQAMLKRMVQVAIDAGVDGLMSNYNYRWGCVCEYCQAQFKNHLRQRYDDDALRDVFGIEDLSSHHFSEIPAVIPGYPDVESASELHWEAMKWGAKHFKEVFDSIFIEHGRSLKHDLIIGTWNHLGFVRHTEERAFTPIELWHHGEDYFWYSGSHGGTDLAERNAGDAWVNLLWLGEMAEGKPFMMGKYEGVRMRAGLAEAAATGGAGTGLYHRFSDPYTAEVMTRHMDFMHTHRRMYEQAQSAAEVGLLLPRQAVLARQPHVMNAFRAAGQALAESQILFEPVLDQRMSDERLARYSALILPPTLVLDDSQHAMIERYVDAGGRTIVMDENSIAADDLEQLTAEVPLSAVAGDWTLRASLMRSGDSLLLHLVNYNRDEAAAEELPRAQRRTAAAELPIAARDVDVKLQLPPNTSASRVTLLSPDNDEPIAIDFTQSNGSISFTVPSVEVYSVLKAELHRRQ